MKQGQKSAKTSFSHSDYGLFSILVLTAVYSLATAFRTHQEIERVIVLWLLAAGMSGAVFRYHLKTETLRLSHDFILSWILLAFAGGALFLTAFLNNTFALQISLLLLMAACLARFTNYKNVFKLLPAGAIFLLLLPNAGYFNSLMSYPLRLICSHITCFILKIFGMQISCDATVLKIGSEEIAVTAACSGINQLEAMFFIGWIIVMLSHEKLICRVSHWLLLLPLVILFNSLRLIITLLLYSGLGEYVLTDTVHNILGYIMVLAVSIVFYFCKSLIPFTETPQKNEVGR